MCKLGEDTGLFVNESSSMFLGEGDVFGDDVCRYSDVGKSVADVFALTYGDVHAIGREELLGALSFYPEYGIQFAKVFRIAYNLRDEVRFIFCNWY